MSSVNTPEAAGQYRNAAKTHGVAAYAGSVNFESVPIGGVSRGGEVQLTAGSYGTTRGSAVLQSGLLPSGFAAYVRGSAQRTNGYRFNSGNASRSVFASGGWFGARDVVKVSLLAGLSANQQAYLASPLSTLRTLPRDNPYGNDDSTAVADRFHQDLLSIAWTRALSPSARLAMTAYGFDAGGWYDVPSTGVSDAFHYNLGSRWGGITGALDWSGAFSTASIGMNVGRYRRGHWLQQRPDLDTRFYENAGHKDEQSAFAKGSVTRGGLTLFGDLQARFVQFRYEPSAGAGVVPARMTWSFVNPKIGVRGAVATGLTAFATVGMNGREPTRADMFAGADDVDSLSAPSVLPLSRVRPETVYDFESGVTFERGDLSAQANVFLMRFRDEIAPIGEINAIGYLLRKNVERSMRRGVETDVTWRASSRVTASGTVSVTESRIDEYRDDASGMVYRGVTALLTPKLVSNHGVRTELTPWLSVDVDGRYTSRMMLTNTDDPRFVVPANWYADLGATVRAGRHSVLVQVRNVLDRRVYTGGYPGTDFSSSNSAAMEPYFYTMAGRNVSVNARFAF